MESNHKPTRPEDAAFMKTMKQFEKWIEQPKVYLLDPKKEEKIYEVQRKIQEILDEETIETKVEIHPCPLGMGDAIIRFTADSLTVRNIKKFRKGIQSFSNFEIYPTAEGIQFVGVISKIAKIIY